MRWCTALIFWPSAPALASGSLKSKLQAKRRPCVWRHRNSGRPIGRAKRQNHRHQRQQRQNHGHEPRRAICAQCGLDTVVAGDIGTPVLQAYMQREGRPADVWVLELSSFQLENTHHLNADAATVLNISEDHLNRYDDLLDYAHAKDKIFRGSSVQVLNADDVLCRAMRRHGREVKWFSLTHESDYSGRCQPSESGRIRFAGGGGYSAARAAQCGQCAGGIGLVRSHRFAAQ